LVSVENEIIGTPRERATCFALVTECANSRLLRAGRGAAVVLDHELDVGAAELGERHLCGIAHRLAGDAGIAARRERQDHADLHPSRAAGRAGDGAGGVAERCRGDGGGRCWRRAFDDRRPAAEQIGAAAATGKRARKRQRCRPHPSGRHPSRRRHEGVSNRTALVARHQRASWQNAIITVCHSGVLSANRPGQCSPAGAANNGQCD
jgi:hypothetical protein